MSSITHPEVKKRLSLKHDHFNRNGQSNKAWRRIIPLKKRKTVRAFRKRSNDLLKSETELLDDNATRRMLSLKTRKVLDWVSVHLGEWLQRKQLAHHNSLDQ
ncbi:MAG: hypothetical protein JW706_08300, partial [Opitutales bacterium]|nr:hypothetical protein [Opitutales bacterium]